MMITSKIKTNKNGVNLKSEKGFKMKMSPKIKMIKKMKKNPKIHTTPRMQISLKHEDYLRLENRSKKKAPK